MSRCLLWLCLAVLIGGCKKQPPPSGTGTESTASEALPSPRGPGPASQPPAAVVVPDAGNPEANLARLTQELRNYVVRSRSVPKNYEEFVAKGHVQAPSPPAGKKYAIRDHQVVLE